MRESAVADRKSTSGIGDTDDGTHNHEATRRDARMFRKAMALMKKKGAESARRIFLAIVCDEAKLEERFQGMGKVFWKW